MNRRSGAPTWRRIVLAGFIGWSAVAVVFVVLAAHGLRQGKALALQARDDASATTLRNGAIAEDLESSARAFQRGYRYLESPLLLPLRIVPVIGRQHRSAAALSKAAMTLSTAGAAAAREVASAVDPPPKSGPARVQALRRIERASEAAGVAIERISLGPTTGLVGPLAEARDDLDVQLVSARRDVRRGTAITAALVDFLDQKRRYVLVAANNAEMRAGSGMFLSVGLLETGGGELDLGEMIPTGNLVLPGPGVPIEGDLAELWGWTEPGRDWRNLAMSPRFEASAPVAARLWEAQMGGEVDGVLAVDVAALRALLATTGPVDVGGDTVSADGVEQRLLHDQYEGLTFEEASGAAQSDRREELGGIARAVVDAVKDGRIDFPALANEMSKAAAGRHILAWSRRPDEQRGWESADISGKLAPNSLAVSLLNRGGNKLDPFLQVETDIATTADADGRSVELTVRLRNTTPEGEPAYIAGPHPDQDVAPGTYVGLLALNLPGTASAISAREALAVVRGADGPTRAIAVAVEVPRGETREFSITFHLPKATDRLVIEPSARLPAAKFTLPGRAFPDDRRVVIDL